MTSDQITQFRTALNNAMVQVGATIEWAKYPGGAEEHGNKALVFLEQALALLPCPVCNGTGRMPRLPGEIHCRLLLCKDLQARCGDCVSYIPRKPCSNCQ